MDKKEKPASYRWLWLGTSWGWGNNGASGAMVKRCQVVLSTVSWWLAVNKQEDAWEDGEDGGPDSWVSTCTPWENTGSQGKPGRGVSNHCWGPTIQCGPSCVPIGTWGWSTLRCTVSITHTLTDRESRLVVAKGKGEGQRMDWEFGIGRCKLE